MSKLIDSIGAKMNIISLEDALEKGYITSGDFVNLICEDNTSNIIGELLLIGERFNLTLCGRRVFFTPLYIRHYVYNISYGHVIRGFPCQS